jgi:DnaJ homolog subfamily C member 19
VIHLALALALAGLIIYQLGGHRIPWVRKRGGAALICLAVAFLLLMLVTGRLHWISGLIMGAVLGIARLVPLRSYVPLLRRLMGWQPEQPQRARRKQVPERGWWMSREEAGSILGVAPTADRNTVIAAHRKLIQKLHPDRGGSDYLASRVNEAKSRLLNEE